MEWDVPTPWKAAPSLLQSSEEAADGTEEADGCVAWDEEASEVSADVIDTEDPDDMFDAADWESVCSGTASVITIDNSELQDDHSDSSTNPFVRRRHREMQSQEPPEYDEAMSFTAPLPGYELHPMDAYDSFTTDDPSFRPVGEEQADDTDYLPEPPFPLFLNKSRFEAVGPHSPTMKSPGAGRRVLPVDGRLPERSLARWHAIRASQLLAIAAAGPATGDGRRGRVGGIRRTPQAVHPLPTTQGLPHPVGGGAFARAS